MGTVMGQGPYREGAMSNTTPDSGPASASPVPFVKRVKIRNYKSIRSCDVELGPLTVLVGRNGAGKSNFLEALNFVKEALRGSLGDAVTSRGGFRTILHEGCRSDNASSPSVGLEFHLSTRQGTSAVYGFELSADGGGGIRVASEFMEITTQGQPSSPLSYEVRGGQVQGGITSAPVDPGNLYLQRLAVTFLREYSEVYLDLSRMGFYNLDPRVMRKPQISDAGELLRPDGTNVTSALGRIFADSPQRKERLLGYLSSIVPEIQDVERVELGPWETLRFRQAAPDPSSAPWEFYAESMSDGTLRALGALVAVAQLAEGDVPVRLVGIEEPEVALHPAASAALMDALKEAAVTRQVVVTTHSPDLLDRLEFESDRLLAVQMRDGATEIGPIDRASRESIQEDLFSPGELLRMDQFEPDWRDLERQRQAVDSMNAERPA
jgi:predicted ATPase